MHFCLHVCSYASLKPIFVYARHEGMLSLIREIRVARRGYKW